MILGKTIRLVALESKHKDRIRDWSNDPEIARFLGRWKPVSEIEHEQWFSTLHKNPSHMYFAIETLDQEKHIGNIWLCDIDERNRKAEIRIMIGETDNQNRGLGTEAIQVISDYAFRDLNLHKVYAYVLGTNPRAKKSFEKVGFVLEGTLQKDRWSENQYIDVFLLGRINPE
jgi:UDP-4-amino-4,6-dideoxy-N-acetyl-beta-L-altrosamine N-acetyltransferase